MIACGFFPSQNNHYVLSVKWEQHFSPFMLNWVKIWRWQLDLTGKSLIEIIDKTQALIKKIYYNSCPLFYIRILGPENIQFLDALHQYMWGSHGIDMMGWERVGFSKVQTHSSIRSFAFLLCVPELHVFPLDATIRGLNIFMQIDKCKPPHLWKQDIGELYVSNAYICVPEAGILWFQYIWCIDQIEFMVHMILPKDS